MLPDFVDCSVVDHQRRLHADALSIRTARLTRANLHGRAASVRSDIGFRLVEAGLRIALGRVESDSLVMSRSTR